MEIPIKMKVAMNSMKYKDDLYDIFWKPFEGVPLEKPPKLSVGLFNIPCAGFGDVILCKSFYDCILQWYPGLNVSICTTTPQKYKALNVNAKFHKLHIKENLKISKDDVSSECRKFDEVYLKRKITFDIMIIVPIINREFDLKEFRSLIPYADYSNTFTVSEYNGEYEPYTFPTGVGKGNLGMLFNQISLKPQKLIKGPYGLVYIQPQPEWGIHSKYCFLSFIEMICKKYHKKHPNFQVVIPDWITEDLQDDSQLRTKLKKAIHPYYGHVSLHNKEEIVDIFKVKTKGKLLFRGDILPKPRDIFVSLMKDSVPDILVTGDQSITDVMSCCQEKHIWYQVAPWKKDFAYHLSLELPLKYFQTFKTSCGKMGRIHYNANMKEFLKTQDFRINGKSRMASILHSQMYFQKHKQFKEDIMNAILHSRYLDTAQAKIDSIIDRL